MRKFMATTATVLALAAVCIAVMGPAMAQTPRINGAHGNRAPRVVVASRTPSTLV